MFNSLQSSNSVNSLTPSNIQNSQTTEKRNFTTFYAQQMDHIKKKVNYVQNNLIKKDKIYEEMKKQRERIKYLSEESRRILSTSREREKSRHRRDQPHFDVSRRELSKTIKNTPNEFSLKTVHERLYQEK
jgi:hypothetical protein